MVRSRAAPAVAFVTCLIAAIASCTGDDPVLTTPAPASSLDGGEGGGPGDGATDVSTNPTDSAIDQASTDAEAGTPSNNYKAILNQANLIAPPMSAAPSASGTASLTYYPGANVICGRLIYSGLTEATPQSAHVHAGAADAGGSIVYTIPIVAGGTLKLKGFLTSVDAGKLTMEGLYIDIHTSANPQVEIRGQIVPDSRTGIEACE